MKVNEGDQVMAMTMDGRWVSGVVNMVMTDIKAVALDTSNCGLMDEMVAVADVYPVGTAMPDNATTVKKGARVSFDSQQTGQVESGRIQSISKAGARLRCGPGVSCMR